MNGLGGAESLNTLRGVRTLKGASVVSGFQWGQWFNGLTEEEIAVVAERLKHE